MWSVTVRQKGTGYDSMRLRERASQALHSSDTRMKNWFLSGVIGYRTMVKLVVDQSCFPLF